MIVQRNAFAVGTLASADPNSHSFQSPDWQNSGSRKRGDQSFGGEDIITITLPTAHRELDAEESRLGEAISLTQTQGAFLNRVQEALERMNELSLLAQAPTQSEAERSGYADEFAELQQRITDLGKKMYDAAKTFCPSQLKVSPDEDSSSFGTTVASLVHASIQGTSDRGLTDLTNPERASAALETIHKTLQAVADIRGKVQLNLERLNATGEQLAVPTRIAAPANLKLVGERTRSICDEILVKSGTAMLAQANALPESALQLLR